jgi:hypothetical protein
MRVLALYGTALHTSHVASSMHCKDLATRRSHRLGHDKVASVMRTQERTQAQHFTSTIIMHARDYTKICCNGMNNSNAFTVTLIT